MDGKINSSQAVLYSGDAGEARDGQQPRDVSLNIVRYDVHSGLVPVTVQDAETRDVLMQAYANREALKRTFGTGEAWFWSRSRQEFWHKGATSGNVLRIKEVRVDCDGDSVLYLVHPTGPACHTGEMSCFYRRLFYDEARSAGAVTSAAAAPVSMSASSPSNSVDSSISASPLSSEMTDPLPEAEASADEESGSLADVLDDMWQVISTRFEERPSGSYTTYLFEHGVDKTAKKVGEEAVEVVIAAKNAVQTPEGKRELASESTDLLYHLFVLWKLSGIAPGAVCRTISSRLKK